MTESNNRLRILLIVEQCNPEYPSVPSIGYNFFQEISKKADVTLCTHGRNQANLEKRCKNDNIFYFQESWLSRYYYRLISSIARLNEELWPLIHALTYPIYAEFNHYVYKKFKDEVLQGKFDLVHAITPIIPRYPVKMVKACIKTPFILGPVNGGIPFPEGFKEIAKKEFNQLNFLRALCYLIPGYTQTYVKADKILAGSSFTLQMIKKMFQIPDHKIQLFYENGLLPIYFCSKPKEKRKEDRIELLFVGRLVPYKGVNFIIEAINKLSHSVKPHIHLNIVGDGIERKNLENLVQNYSLSSQVSFVGRVEITETVNYYQHADIFCFPSLREFGGAAVLEAMAAGLPCLVVDYGGIAEYVTDETGFKISPSSSDQIIKELTEKIELLVDNFELRIKMGKASIERAREFEWEHKANQLMQIYTEILNKQKAINQTITR